MVKRSVIDRIDFLAGLDVAAREALASRAVLRRLAAGGRLWTAGDQPRGLFVILSGEVRVVRTAGARQHVVHTEGAGATIGEIPLFAGGTYPATAVAASVVEFVVLDRASLMTAMRDHPEIAWTLLARLATRVRHLLDRLSSQTSDPVSARLAAYLLRQPARPDGSITMGRTQQQVAEEIGTVREVVVRTLRAFVADGVIEVRGRARYALRDPRALQRLAGWSGDPPREHA